jgi:hypothetical protein
MIYEIKTTTRIPLSRVEDLVCCALEGGSTYWCRRFEPDSYPEGKEWGHEAVAAGISFTIRPDEADGSRYIKNSPDLIEQTLQLMAEQYPDQFNDFVKYNDDAETGDVFFQLLCFGEVIYG